MSSPTTAPSSSPIRIPCTHATDADATKQGLHHLSQQQSAWHCRARTELINTSRSNMLRRLSEITNMVNTHHASLSGFHVAAENAKQMINDVDQAIHAWQGVDIASCKQYKATFKEYKTTATNWFNRKQSQIYGNYFFYPLIFKYILKYVANRQMNEDAKMALFVDILLLIADGRITFLRSRAQPMLPHQMLIQANEFKKACQQLLAFYHEEWRSNSVSPCKINRIYQKDKNRSNKIFGSFLRCLRLVQHKLKSACSRPSSSQYGFFSVPASVLPGFIASASDRAISTQRNEPQSTMAIKNEPDLSVETDELDSKVILDAVAMMQQPPNKVNAVSAVNIANTTGTANQSSRRMFDTNQAWRAPGNGSIDAPIPRPSFVETHDVSYRRCQCPNLYHLQNVQRAHSGSQPVDGYANGNNLRSVFDASPNTGIYSVNNGINVRYQLLWLHPSLDPIVISSAFV